MLICIEETNFKSKFLMQKGPVYIDNPIQEPMNAPAQYKNEEVYWKIEKTAITTRVDKIPNIDQRKNMDSEDASLGAQFLSLF